jgi:LPS export ABC transporter permease LptF/LPS export ABC transporter permease LptG
MTGPPLGVLDRYVLRELGPPFGLGLAVFTCFLLLDRLYQLTELVITKGVPFHLVAQLLVVMLPGFLAHSLPIALLLAVMLAGGRLAGDLELVALRAAGVSPLRLLRPVVVAALLVTLATGALTLVLAPAATEAFQGQLFKILKVRATAGLRERVFNTAFGGMVLYVEEISASQVRLRGLVVSDERDPALTRVITAREGRLLTDERRQRVTLRLLDGGVHEADVLPAGAPAAGGGAAGPDRYRYTSFAVYDMALALEPARPGRFDKPEKALGVAALTRTLATLEDPEARGPYAVEFHKRLALPFAALVFSLVGFALAVRSHRGGRGGALVATLALVVAYYVVLGSLESLALGQRVPVWAAMWAPNALFGAGALGLLALTLRDWRLPGRRRRRVPVGRRGPEADRRDTPSFAPAGRESTLILDRYLLRQYVRFLGVTLAVGAVLFIVIDLLDDLDRYLRLKPPLVHIAEYFLYRVPAALHEGLPIAMLVATIFLFLGLSRYHELTALKAAGVGLYRTSAPVLLFALFVVGGAAAFQEVALPVLNERGDEVSRVKIRGHQPRHLQSRARLWLRSSETRFYRVELVSPVTHELLGLTMLELDPDFRLTRRLDARRAHWTPAGWELADGAFRTIDGAGGLATRPFERATVALDEGFTEFTQVQKPVSAMSYRELREYVARLQAAGFRATKYVVDLHAKASDPLKNLILVLVAIPFALQAPRGGRLVGLGLAIALTAAYMMVDFSARAFAKADLLPPILAAWTANVVFLGVGASLFLRART